MSLTLQDLGSHIVMDVRKFTEYALNPEAPQGRHKAIVFGRVLGYTLDNWQELYQQVETLAPGALVQFHSEDSHGRRFTTDLLLRGPSGREATVRMGWIVPPGLDAVRLVTLWIDE